MTITIITLILSITPSITAQFNNNSEKLLAALDTSLDENDEAMKLAKRPLFRHASICSSATLCRPGSSSSSFSLSVTERKVLAARLIMGIAIRVGNPRIPLPFRIQTSSLKVLDLEFKVLDGIIQRYKLLEELRVPPKLQDQD